MAAKKTSSWQIESLFKRAFERTKKRFFSYLFVYVIGIGIGLLALLGILLLGVVLFFAFKALNNAALITFLGVVLGAGLLGGLIYLGSWIQLTVLSVIGDDTKVSVNESMKKTRPLVPGFIVLNILTGFFIFGLLPFGLVTLFIVFLAWAVWGSMAGFVYLYHKQPKGLRSLWLSREMVRPNFWKITGRMLLVLGVFYLITILFSLSKNSLLSSLVPLISLVSTPFILAFVYEMYKNLSVPKKASTPKVWVTLSVIGWVAMIVIGVSVGTFLTSVVDQMMKGNKTAPPVQYTLPAR